MKLLLRIISCPFVFAIIAITYNYHAIRNTVLFLKHGGEWMTYAGNERKSIQDIYNLIKENQLK